MCYYMRNCIRLTIIKRLDIEAFWFFCAVLPLQKVGQTIGITSSSQLWQYIKYSQFRFLQLHYTAKQLSCQSFFFFANWTACKAAAVLFRLEDCYSHIPRARRSPARGCRLDLSKTEASRRKSRSRDSAPRHRPPRDTALCGTRIYGFWAPRSLQLFFGSERSYIHECQITGCSN